MLKQFIIKQAAKGIRLTDRVFSTNEEPLLRGDLVAYGREKFPPEHYQTMWVDIPEDLRRGILWDGRLLNGDMPAELAKARVTDELVTDMLIKSGLRALLITGIIAVFISLMVTQNLSLSINGDAWGMTEYPFWAAKAGVWLPVASWYVLTAIERFSGAIGTILGAAVPFLLLFPVIWYWAFMSFMDRMWRKLSLPYRYPSSDTQHFWKGHVAERIKDYRAYKRVILESQRIADMPLLPVGIAEGIVRARGDNAAPTQGQVVCFDGESLRQHVYIAGKTGSGKTRLAFSPLFKHVMSDVWGDHKMGAYVTDGKATLWRDLKPLVAHRKDDVKVIGIEPGQYGIDLIHGMSPLEVSAMFEAVDSQVSGGGGGGKDAFWKISASDAIREAATIAYILEKHPATVVEWKKVLTVRPYSLLSIHMIACQPYYTELALATFIKVGDELRATLPDAEIEAFNKATESARWFMNTFLKMSVGQRDGIIGHVSAVLGKLKASRTVVDRFCAGSTDQAIDVDHALNGGIIMIAIGSSGELGVVGKLMAVWLKTQLMFLAARRLEQTPELCKLSSCGLFADEFQMLCTTVGDKSDVEFWNMSRQTGLFLCCATQNISALRLKMGDTAANNFLSQMNSKIILEIDEKETIEWAEYISGKLPWAWQPDPRFYSTQAARELLIGNDSEPAEMERLDGLFPTMFIPVVDQVEDGWGGKIMRAPKAMLNKAMGRKRGVSTYMQEGQEGFEGETVMEHFLPKIRQADLQTGAGFAFAMIRRANSTRIDMVDLKIST